MRHHHVLFLLALGCGLGSSCSSDPPSNSPTSSTSAASISATATSSPVTYSTGVFGGTQSVACATDLDQMETVVDSSLALNGGTEVTEDQLVEQGLLREPSVLHDIGPGATVIPSPTGGCVS